MNAAVPETLWSDAPVTQPSGDQFGRAHFAKALAQRLAEVPSQDGFVFAVHGDWGSGKTSVVNLVVHYAEELAGGSGGRVQLVTVRFNPWWYSSGDDLLLRLLAALSQAVGRHDTSGDLKRLAGHFATLGKALAPLRLVPGLRDWAGPAKEVFETADAAVSAAAEALAENVQGARDAVTQALRGGEQRLLVVVDDVDRLAPDEITQLFRVVKAVANFPNTVYLLAFDRQVISESLSKALDVDGAAFVGKIVQASVELPLPAPERILQIVTAGLGHLLLQWGPDNWDRPRWLHVLHDGLRHLLRTPRDAKRYLNAVHLFCTPSVQPELNPVDVFALEALRLFAPAIYDVVRLDIGLFVEEPERRHAQQRADELQKRHDQVAEEARGLYGEPVVDVLRQLFPFCQPGAVGRTSYGPDAASGWRRERRLCSPEVAPVYFQLAVPDGGIGWCQVRGILDVAADAGALEERLIQIANETEERDPQFAQRLLTRLEDHTQDDIPDGSIEPFVAGLLNAADTMVAKAPPRGPFGHDMSMSVARLVYQLLRRLPQTRRCEVLLKAVRTSRSPSAVVYEVSLADPSPDAADEGREPDDGLIAGEHLPVLREAACRRIQQAAEEGTLAHVPRLAHVLWCWRRWEGDDAPSAWFQSVTRDDQALASAMALLLDSGCSYALGEYHYERRWSVPAELLDALVGGPGSLEQRVRAILASAPDWLDAARRTALTAYLSHKERGPEGMVPWCD